MKKAVLTKFGLGMTSAAVLAVANQAAAADSYIVQAGDSFYSIASQHAMDMEVLAARNGKTLDSLILPGDVLEVDGVVSSTQELMYDSNLSQVAYSPEENTYPVGQCTWGVKELAPWASNWWGNANTWAIYAASYGFQTGYTPVEGAIAVWTSGTYGHVAYVTAVDPATGLIQVMEANYGGTGENPDPRGLGNYRGWFDPNESGAVTYIYPQ